MMMKSSFLVEETGVPGGNHRVLQFPPPEIIIIIRVRGTPGDLRIVWVRKRLQTRTQISTPEAKDVVPGAR